MKCVYINLDRDAVRRKHIEQSFAVAQAKAPDWSIERFPAVDIRYVSQHATPGCIGPAEKGCFLSHKHIMLRNADQTGNLYITEDDAVFSPDTLCILQGLLRKIEGVVEWDLLFTDIGVPAIGVMADVVAMTQEVFRKGTIELADLVQFSRLYGATAIYGSTAYVINPKSISKILGLMGDDPLDLPYDLFLRSLIYKGMINAYVTLPFISTVSDDGLSSSIQRSEHAKTDLVWNLFRKMIWLDGAAFDPTAVLNKMLNEIDPRSRQYGALWAIMSDPSFKLK